MADARDIHEEVDRFTARLAAAEGVVVRITAALLEAVEPGLAREVIESIRSGLIIPMHNEFQRLVAEEHLQRLADDIEARVRAKIGSLR